MRIHCTWYKLTLSNFIPRVLAAQMTALSFAFSWVSRPTLRLSFPPLLRSRVQKTLSLFSIISLLVTLYRWPADPKPSKPGNRIVNAGIWTVHFGIDNVGRDSQRRVRDLIKYVILFSENHCAHTFSGTWSWTLSDCWKLIYT